MSILPKDISATLLGREEVSELLYTSARTKVVCLGSQGKAPAAGRIVWKEYLGADADLRLRHEKDMLARLAGIEGVVQLAVGPHPPKVLALQSAGPITLAQALREDECDLATILAMTAR